MCCYWATLIDCLKKILCVEMSKKHHGLSGRKKKQWKKYKYKWISLFLRSFANYVVKSM